MSNFSGLPLTVPDLLWGNDMDLMARATVSDLQTLEQDVLHILAEVLGSSIDDPTRGIGISSMLSGPTTLLTNVAALIDTQLTKDPRIDAVATTVTQDAPGTYYIQVQVTVSNTVIGLTYAYNSANGVFLP